VRVVKRGRAKVYRGKCPECGTVVEATHKDLVGFGPLPRIQCPVDLCGKHFYVKPKQGAPDA